MLDDECREQLDLLQRERIKRMQEKPVRWLNVFREEVDLDNIDREYALNILLMAHAKRARMGYLRQDFIEDPLMQKLREIVLDGRKPSLRDRLRAKRYNLRCRLAGLPYRARRS